MLIAEAASILFKLYKEVIRPYTVIVPAQSGGRVSTRNY